MNRRHFLFASAAAGTGAIFALKPSDAGASYTPYFAALNSTLRHEGPAKPSLLIDLDILDHNIGQLLREIPTKAGYRIAVKSLPSPTLVEYVMQKTNTNRLMVFHQPFLNHIASSLPYTDVLMGKPMPVNAAARFYQLLPADSRFNTKQQLQWLIDTKERAQQYLSLAKRLNTLMQINIEIDVGLHRGGVKTIEELDEIMVIILNNPKYLRFSGFMGYDPQVVKFPEFIKTVDQAYRESQALYRNFINHVTSTYSQIDVSQLCLNGAGSPTLPVHGEDTVLNDVTAGSCLVKPIQFDIPQLAPFKPAAFIATPILKKLTDTRIPGLEDFSSLLSRWDPNRQQTLFIYGGKWKAEYLSPAGLIGNAIYGTSTNQMMVNCSLKANVDVDDYVFLRPEQSEFVFLQFGELIITRGDHIVNRWTTLHE